MKKTMLYSFFLFMLITLSSEKLLPLRSSYADCLAECGEINIEYPFRLTNCYDMDEDFTITCNYSSSAKPKAILTKFNLEVLQIQTTNLYEGQVTVKAPIWEDCASGNVKSDNGKKSNTKGWTSLNLSGSQFFYDTTNNVFASLGCDGNASLYNEEGRIVGQCNNKDKNYCSCQTDLRSIPPLKSYSIGMGLGKSGSSCRSAFLTSRTFLAANVTFTMATTDSVVPLVLRFSMQSPYFGLIFLVLSIPCALGALVISSCCFWWCWLAKTKKGRKETKLRKKYFIGKLKEQRSSNKELLQKIKLFSTRELKKATNNFNAERVLGQGGQSTVYKGMLTNGQVIAVKKPKAFDESEWKQFINEVILLSQVTHRNVVKLLGCCLETKSPLLVYEFIPNDTLSYYIHDEAKAILITWEARVRIACEAASAIAYLHSSSSTPIYHRDIKSTNILLDDKYQAKVSDFGISTTVGIDQTHLTTCVQGTFGYLDPEYFESSQFSEKSDVYSFGVILVELLTGQLPIRVTALDEERSLVEYFLSSMNESTNLDDILDAVVLEGSTKEEVMIVANVAQRCLNSRGVERPTMHEVVSELERVRKRPSPTSITFTQVSLDIENVVTRSAPVTGNAYMSPTMKEVIDITSSNCDDEEPLFYRTW